MSDANEDNVRDLGYGQDRSEDFCTTILAMVLQNAPEFAQSFASLVLGSVKSAQGLEKLGRIRVSGQECIERFLPGCNRYPDLWLRCWIGAEPKPFLILVEVKVGSGESPGQMVEYRRFVDSIQAGSSSEFGGSALVFLSFYDNPKLSAHADLYMHWRTVLALLDRHLKEATGFEARFVSSVHRHLSHIQELYACRAPLGTADDFVVMLRGVPERYPWLQYLAPKAGGLQHTLVPIPSHPWIQARTSPLKAPSSALIGVDPHRVPHLNSLPKSWLSLLMPAGEDIDAWHNKIRRVKENIADLQVVLEDVLQAMDARRQLESR